MEVLNLIITSVVSIVVSLGGGILFFHSRSRKESAEATSSEHSAESVAIANMRESAVEWKEIAENREEKIILKERQIVNKDKKIDSLYLEKSEDRNKIYSLTQKINTLELEKQALQYRSCSIRGCANREPQSGF